MIKDIKTPESVFVGCLGSVDKIMPFPSPEDLPDPGIEPGSPALQADALQ